LSAHALALAVALGQLDPYARARIAAALENDHAAPAARALVDRIAATVAEAAEDAVGGPEAAWERHRARTARLAASRPGWKALTALYREQPLKVAGALRDAVRDGRVGVLPAIVPPPVRPTGQATTGRSSLSVAQLDLLGEIGPSGVSVDGVAVALRAASDAQEVRVTINSSGGDLSDGIAIMNLLRAHPGLVHTEVIGVADSAASVIFMAGDVRTMAAGSSLLIHGPTGLCAGNEADFRAMAEQLDRMADAVARIYRDRCGGRIDTWHRRMRQETSFSGREAVSVGLADHAL
jgi:ATP-dependent protease ClpP protease subunit